MISKIKKQITFLILFFASIVVVSQESWDFGIYQKAFITTPSPPLKIKMYAKTSLSSSRFVTRVGGVSFNSIAIPDSSLENVQVDYEYIESNFDGNRLKITIKGEVFYPYIPDWQLIPIIKFANSRYHSCVSLFGPETDDSKFDIVYHPEFKNTLLGVRLFQADIALMNLETHWQLPKFNSKIVYGKGESINNQYWESSANQIQTVLNSYTYQSWVLTDDLIDIVFNIQNNKLTFNGKPYYYFWKINYLETKLLKQRSIFEYEKYKKINNSMEKIIIKHDSLVELHNSGNKNFELQLNELKKKYKQKEGQLVIIENNINKIINKIDEYDYKVNNVTKLTNNLKNKYYVFLNYNPSLYSAVKNVAQYAAFFRFLRKQNNSKWKTFYEKCSRINVLPEVRTPTQLPK